MVLPAFDFSRIVHNRQAPLARQATPAFRGIRGQRPVIRRGYQRLPGGAP